MKPLTLLISSALLIITSVVVFGIIVGLDEIFDSDIGRSYFPLPSGVIIGSHTSVYLHSRQSNSRGTTAQKLILGSTLAVASLVYAALAHCSFGELLHPQIMLPFAVLLCFILPFRLFDYINQNSE